MFKGAIGKRFGFCGGPDSGLGPQFCGIIYARVSDVSGVSVMIGTGRGVEMGVVSLLANGKALSYVIGVS